MPRSVDTEQSPFYSEVRHAGKKKTNKNEIGEPKKLILARGDQGVRLISRFLARRSGSAPHFQSSAGALALSCRKGGTTRSLEGLGFLVPT